MNKLDLTSLASAPVTKARNSNNKTWALTDKAHLGMGGQQAVIIKALASLGGKATTAEIVAKIESMMDTKSKEYDEGVHLVMQGKADQGASTIVAHYASEKVGIAKKGMVTFS